VPIDRSGFVLIHGVSIPSVVAPSTSLLFSVFSRLKFGFSFSDYIISLVSVQFSVPRPLMMAWTPAIFTPLNSVRQLDENRFYLFFSPARFFVLIDNSLIAPVPSQGFKCPFAVMEISSLSPLHGVPSPRSFSDPRPHRSLSAFSCKHP